MIFLLLIFGLLLKKKNEKPQKIFPINFMPKFHSIKANNFVHKIVNFDLTAGPTTVLGDILGLYCVGQCTADCKSNCIKKNFKNGFCVKQGGVNVCCCT